MPYARQVSFRTQMDWIPESNLITFCIHTTENNALHKWGNRPTTKETYKKKSMYTPTSTNHIKHTHAAEDRANKSHKKIEAVLLKLIRRPI
jgi:hypothetical protein